MHLNAMTASQLPTFPTDAAWGAAPMPQLSPQPDALLKTDDDLVMTAAHAGLAGLTQVPVMSDDVFQRALQQAMDRPAGQFEARY